MQYKLVTATKEFSWDMAHMLTGHKSLCKNLHGHTYRMLVTVSRIQEDVISSDLPESDDNKSSEGMVMDFQQLKAIVQSLIVEKFDHALVVNSAISSGFENAIRSLANSFGLKMVELPYRPTAELMAMNFFEELEVALKQRGIALIKLRLYETPTSYAEVSI